MLPDVMKTPWRLLMAAEVALVVAGCGGNDDPAVASAQGVPRTAAARWSTAARLNAEESKAAAQVRGGIGAQPSIADRTQAAALQPVYRFCVAGKGFHFYTASGGEAATIRTTLPRYLDEGVGYHVAGAPTGPPPGATAFDNASCRVSLVGPGKTCSVPSAAAAVAQTGDVVRIDAGDCRGDVAT